MGEEGNDNILQGSIQSASYNMILQVLFSPFMFNTGIFYLNFNFFFCFFFLQIAFRVITFVLNGLVLHNVDKDVLGIL